MEIITVYSENRTLHINIFSGKMQSVLLMLKQLVHVGTTVLQRVKKSHVKLKPQTLFVAVRKFHFYRWIIAMSLQENVTEEDLMLNILIDECIQSESSAENHCSQKRKAADLEYEDNLEEKRSLDRVFYVLYIVNVIDISNKMRRLCPYVYLHVSAPKPHDGFE
jgi:hypothetical protein